MGSLAPSTRRRARELGFHALALALTLLVAWRFYGPARAAAPDVWPAPLDDVYIHYDFARALAEGHPFAWISGQGYSSGETAPAYAVVLAFGYLVGFRGAWLGLFAAVVACASVLSLLYTTRGLMRLAGPVPSWATALAPTLLLACGTLDFALWSGMEVALFAAVAARFLRAVAEARAASPVWRPARQLHAGALGALLVLLRPEAAILVGVAMFIVARRAYASPFAACLRVAAPGAAVTLGLAALNFALTGDTASAGARLKLLSSNPFTTDVDRARDYMVSLVTLAGRLRRDLGDGHGRYAFVLPLLAALSLTSRRTRGLGAVCLGGAVAFTLVASWNGAARYQNLRDYMPGVALLLVGSALGLASLATRASVVPRLAGAALATSGALLGWTHLATATEFYRRACANIHDQQVVVGRRLAARAAASGGETIVLLGDAGAIPYVSRLHAIDALGLGGYHGEPFVRAAVHGEAATIELLERLPEAERPTVLALYPNWFPGLTERFGTRVDEVSIEDNVICGGTTKGIYTPDWSALRSRGAPPDEPFETDVVDELDVGDVVSEEAHAYVSPAPDGGWTLFDIREATLGARRFDAGRVVPAGREESFVARAGADAGGELVLRVDESLFDATLVLEAEGREVRVRFVTPLVDLTRLTTDWRLSRATLPVALHAGDRLHIEVGRGALHDFHAWVVRGKP